jgi:hypothetical protein
MLPTCIISQGTAAVAGGEAGTLPRLGLTLLLVRQPQWLAGGRGNGRHAWARWCPRRQVKRTTEQKQRGSTVEQEKEQRGVTIDGGAGRRAVAAGRPTEQEQAG